MWLGCFNANQIDWERIDLASVKLCELLGPSNGWMPWQRSIVTIAKAHNMNQPLRLWMGIALVSAIFVASQRPVAAQSKTAPPAPVVPERLDAGIQSQQSGVRMTLLAEHPALVTPTGIDVDKQGNIWLISCHTHFRPAGYDGPNMMKC